MTGTARTLGLLAALAVGGCATFSDDGGGT